MALEESKLTTGDRTKGPVYEVIKRQDLVGAFRDAMRESLSDIIQRLNEIADLYSAIAQPGLWTWGYASRWDYDKWW
jgi:hypothetical protein